MLKELLFMSGVVLTYSCGNNSSEITSVPQQNNPAEDSAASTGAQPENEMADFKFHKLILNIPSPFEIINLLPKTGMEFNKALVNPSDHVSKYLTSFKKGLNYGVYGVDMIYLSTNEQYSDMKKYFITTRKLAQDLEAAESFDKIVGMRIDKEVNSKDTMNIIMDELYSEMDNYLKSNERLLTSIQITVGSWIESQYITLYLLRNIERTEKNKILFQKVFEARNELKELLGLLKEYESDKEFNPLIQELKTLDKLFESVKSDEADKSTIMKISDNLNSIRSKIVN